MYSYEIKSNRPTLASSLREPIANGMTTSSSLFGYLMRNAIRGSQWHPVRVSDEECNQRLSEAPRERGFRMRDAIKDQSMCKIRLPSLSHQRATNEQISRSSRRSGRSSSLRRHSKTCLPTGKPRAIHGQSTGNQRAISTRRLACPQATGTVPSRGNLARSPGFGPRT